MNAALIPFVLVPVLALAGGIALIVMAISGQGPHNTFLILGSALTAVGVILPMLFILVQKPRKRR